MNRTGDAAAELSRQVERVQRVEAHREEHVEREAPRREAQAQPDFFGVAIGGPMMGKSSLANKVIQDELECGTWVFAHDPSGQYARTCATYPSFAAWRTAAAAAAAANRPMPRGAAITGDVRELLDGVAELGERYNRQTLHRFPMLVVCDEGSLLESGSTHTDKGDLRLFSRRRHLGVRFLLLIQHPTMVSKGILILSTDVFLFAVARKEQPRLEDLLFLDEGALAGLENLEKYNYVHVRRGLGFV